MQPRSLIRFPNTISAPERHQKPTSQIRQPGNLPTSFFRTSNTQGPGLVIFAPPIRPSFSLPVNIHLFTCTYRPVRPTWNLIFVFAKLHTYVRVLRKVLRVNIYTEQWAKFDFKCFAFRGGLYIRGSTNTLLIARPVRPPTPFSYYVHLQLFRSTLCKYFCRAKFNLNRFHALGADRFFDKIFWIWIKQRQQSFSQKIILEIILIWY